MGTNLLPPAVLAKLAARLPSGYDVANMRVIRASATIASIDRPDSQLESALLASLETAGGVPMITDGKPTVMRVVAWVAHEGVNHNRLAFVADDLVEAAAKIGQPDGLLPMDFNHSAVNQWVMEQAVIGVWYAAEVRDNPNARAPRGPKGLLAQGLVWSWAFPDYSTRLLAEQARHDNIEFSMACIPQWTEIGKDDQGEYEIARKPVFFTFSALDVDPADPDAKGLGEEGSSDPQVEDRLKETLTTRTADLAERILKTLRRRMQRATHEDKQMDETVKSILDVLQANAERIATQEGLDAVKAQLEGLVELVRTKPGELAEKTQKIEELTGKVQELETALAAAKLEVERANTELAALTAKVQEQTTQLQTYQAKEQEAAATARLVARLAALPEHIRQAHEAQDEEKRQVQETRWAAKSDEEWQEVLDVLSFVPRTASFLHRSKEQGGPLPTGVGDKSAVERLSKFRS